MTETKQNWSTGLSVFEKIDKVQIGTTHIKQSDAAGVEHIGIIESFDEDDNEWVNVIEITPAQSGRHETEDIWSLVTAAIEL